MMFGAAWFGSLWEIVNEENEYLEIFFGSESFDSETL